MSKAAREQSAREKMREDQRKQEARQKTMRRLLIGGSAALVIALAVGIGVFVQTNRAQGGGEFEGQLPPPTIKDGAVVMAKEGGNKPVVDVYEDFRCPHCKELEDRSGDTFKRLVANGKAKVVYHPVAVIDQGSLRTGAASLCAAKQDAFTPMHDKLFENQTASSDMETLKGYASDIGLDGSKFESCVQQQRNQILQNTRQAQQKPGFKGTPTVYLNGERMSTRVANNPDQLRQAVTSAGKPPPSSTGNPSAGSTATPSAGSTQ